MFLSLSVFKLFFPKINIYVGHYHVNHVKCYFTIKRFRLIFTARRHTSAVGLYAVVVCFVTSRCSIETGKRRITQTTPHNSPGRDSFSDAEYLGKTQTGSPQRRR